MFICLHFVYLFTFCLWVIFKINMLVGLGPAAAGPCSDGSGCVPAGASWSCWTPVRTSSCTSSTAPGKPASAPLIKHRRIAEKRLHRPTFNVQCFSVSRSCRFTWFWFWTFNRTVLRRSSVSSGRPSPRWRSLRMGSTSWRARSVFVSPSRQTKTNQRFLLKTHESRTTAEEKPNCWR